ncbi:MAG: hypothetical protein PUB18_06105 [bacterium]|nr:hypothetical protein [bacterium]
MEKYKRCLIFSIIVLIASMGLSNNMVNALSEHTNGPECAFRGDSKQWEYMKTVDNANRSKTSIIGSNQQIVCCELGASMTKRYMCDYYKFIPTDDNPTNPNTGNIKDEIDNSIDCDLSSGEWNEDGQNYTSYFDESGESDVEKVCCRQITGGPTTGTTYSCNRFFSKQYVEDYPEVKNPENWTGLNGENIKATCEGIIGSDLLEIIDEIFTYIKIAAPILLIVLGCADFGQAVISDDKDALKKAASKFVKRAVICVAIFFIPSIVNYLLGFIENMTTDPTCGIK